MLPWHRRFLEQIKYNKEYAKDKIAHDQAWRNMTWLLCHTENSTFIMYNPDNLNDCWTEFVEFIDGNGFKIVDKELVDANYWKVVVEYDRNG